MKYYLCYRVPNGMSIKGSSYENDPGDHIVLMDSEEMLKPEKVHEVVPKLLGGTVVYLSEITKEARARLSDDPVLMDYIEAEMQTNNGKDGE